MIKISSKRLLTQIGVLFRHENNAAVSTESDDSQKYYDTHEGPWYCLVALLSLICERDLLSI
jgi:hypothetical protein